MRRSLFTAALSLLASLGCSVSKPAEPRDIRDDRLERRVRELRFEGPCASLVTRQAMHLTPIPTLHEDRVVLVVLFAWPAGVPAHGPAKQWSPAWRGRIELDSGKVLDCEALDGEPTLLGEREIAAKSTDAYTRARGELNQATEALIAAWRVGEPLPPAEVRRYRKNFDATTSPLLAPYYRGVNPEWWTRTGGR